jgi:hypothetical protein
MQSEVNRHAAKVAVLSGAVAFLLAAALLYVTAPPRGLDGYRERAAYTTEALGSQVQTALLWAETRDDDKALAPATLVAFEEAEVDAATAASSFEGFTPPSGGERWRTRFVALAAEVDDALARLRIAADRGRWEEMPALSEPLPRLARELARFEERAEP